MRNHDENALHDATWLGGVPPCLPAFAGKSPPASSVATSWYDDDVVLVSLGGGPLERISAGRLKALLRDGRTEGHVHVGVKGEVQVAPFAVLRFYIFGPE